MNKLIVAIAIIAVPLAGLANSESAVSEIRTCAQLQNMILNDENAHYKLVYDLRCDRLTPIGGDGSGKFMGMFDGNGKTIYVGTIVRLNGSPNNVGLFGATSTDWEANSPVTIKNLTLKKLNNNNDFNVIGEKNVGGLVGQHDNLSLILENVVVELDIKGNENVGGILGHLTEDGLLYPSGSPPEFSTNTISTGRIQGTKHVGGVVGYSDANFNFAVNGFGSTGSISGDDYVGGVVGKLFVEHGDTSYLYNTYSTATINSDNITGGLIGEIEYVENPDYPHTVQFSSSYYAGKITNQTDKARPLLGNIKASSSGEPNHDYVIRGVFWDKDVNHDLYNDLCQSTTSDDGFDQCSSHYPQTTSSLKNKELYLHFGVWDLKIVWELKTPNVTYPILRKPPRSNPVTD